MNILSQEEQKQSNENKADSKNQSQLRNNFDNPQKRSNPKLSFKNNAFFFLMAILLSIFLGTAFGFLASETANKGLKNKVEELSEIVAKMKEEEEEEINFSQVEEEKATISVVKKNLPAVVNVVVTKDVPLLEEYFFDPFDFFGFGGPSYPSEPERRKEKLEAGQVLLLTKMLYHNKSPCG